MKLQSGFEGVCVSVLFFQSKTSVVFLYFPFMNLSWRTRFILQSQTLPNSLVRRLSGTRVKTQDKSITRQMPKGSVSNMTLGEIVLFKR